MLGGQAISEILFELATAGGHTLVLLAFPDTPEPAGGELILGFTTPDLASFIDRVRSAGGTIVDDMVSRPGHGVKVAIVTDVEGHLIEAVQLL